MPVKFPSVRVGEPISHQALSVFPLFIEPNGDVDYLLADEAIRENTLIVEEVSQAGSVPDLLVENKGDIRVLFIEGEELVGAKQNRILNTSLLVAARTKTKIPVSCVEQGRWRHKSQFFGSSGSHSPSKIRYALKASVTDSLQSNQSRRSNQGKVWEEVAAFQDAFGGKTPTGAMSETFDAYQDRVAEFRDQLKYVDGAAGMAVAIGDKIVGYDLFDKPSTCRKVWDRLLSGLVFESLEAKATEKQMNTTDVERLLTATENASWQATEPIGEGDEYRAELGNGEHGSALAFQDSLVHGSVLAGA